MLQVRQPGTERCPEDSPKSRSQTEAEPDVRPGRQAPGPCSDRVTTPAVPETALDRTRWARTPVTEHCPLPASCPFRQAGEARQVDWVSLAI